MLRRERIRMVRETVEAMRGLPKKVALKYMCGCSDLDVRDELKITVSELGHVRGYIRRALIGAGINGDERKWRV